MTENKTSQLNVLEKSKRIIKYILMGFIILVAVRYIPNQPIVTQEIIIIGLISSISCNVRHGMSFNKSNSKLKL